VVVLDIKKDEEVTYLLVMTEETDASRGMISTGSPIGRSLVGKGAGEVVKVQLPGGVRELEILRLKTIHELAEKE
jgi:transcription elongation factor GreA